MDAENERQREVIVDLDLGRDSEAVDLSGKVHQLPCTVKLDGPCSVSHYFKPKFTGIEVDGLSVEEAYFRGRKLQGATISLPEGYSGFVLGRKDLGKRKASEQSQDSWEVKAKFGNITYWNHSTLPSQDDMFRRSFHWLTVAQALHQPVTAEDLASASTAHKSMS
ncbi:ribonuclease H2 subunit C [Momordica charantia]|uniref:Ribonuclease H2 subunit C n=1 Tax=Momordica charantia TaxID=3673 RepID=A0A6J1CLH6_MOMCH|nr:ribonuclease H2 subunit C [Momordica charantia]XP_022142419.1 ribonuclease H2 subunit C [Momordica charantia]XP_022142420.1 ribonuclease H2 subunit C [Momordica charantia]